MLATIFDTETSGLILNGRVKPQHQPSIIEFYGCMVDLATGEVTTEYDALIKPPLPIDADITRITGLTNADLADAPPFRTVADDIAHIIEAPHVCIAHNMSFDAEMLDIEFRRLDRLLLWPRQICTVEQTVHLKGFRLTLTNLHLHLFGVPFKDAHRARQDVEALTRCCVELYKRGML